MTGRTGDVLQHSPLSVPIVPAAAANAHQAMFRSVRDRGGIVGVPDQLSEELGGLRWPITI
jgi:hypothetical protein